MYLLFGKYSQESIQKISAARTEEVMELIKENGGEYISGYALLGEQDIVVVVDLPGIEEAIKVSVGMAKMFGIAVTTSPAVSIGEFDKLVG
jgi:uncharacterized protein with GYD domain